MTGPKTLNNKNNDNVDPKDIGFKVGTPLTEEQFKAVKEKENVKLLHCNVPKITKEKSDDVRKKMREKLSKMQKERTNTTE
jgi:hypothetical protein